MEIDDVGEEFEVFVKGFSGGSEGEREREGEGEGEEEKEKKKEKEKEKEEWPRDPRGLLSLGSRTVLPSGWIQYSSAAADAAAAAADAADAYASTRYALGVAEGSELEPGRGTPLEANLDGLRGVSFSKGCYVGQELVARAHFRGQVHKRVMPVQVVVSESRGGGGGGGGGEESGAASSSLVGRDVVVVAASDSNGERTSHPSKPARSAGRLLAFCAESGRGLALLRLNSVRGLLENGGEGEGAPRLVLAPKSEGAPEESGGGLVFSPSRPGWWPDEWGRD